MKTKITFLLLFFAQLMCVATNRYVSSINGSTSGTGTQGNAYKNLSQLPALAAGDTVFLECGSLFRESISLFAGGNASANLVFTSYGTGAKPIISGADTVANWTQAGNKYYATVSGSVGNFFANNKEQIVARTPDEGTYYQLDSAQTTYLKDAQLTEPNGYWNGAKICVHTAQWCWEKSSVSNYQNGKVDYSSPLGIAALAQFGYFFYNKDSCLNAAKEWYYDSLNSRLYFIPQSGNPNSLLCEVSSRLSGILFQNTASYVSISNIRFEKQSNVGIGLGNQSKRVTIYNCEFFGQYNHGIQTRGKYHLIQNCSFNEVDGHGIDMNQGGNAEVSHCNFKNIGQFRNSGIGGQSNLSAIAVNFADSCWLHHNVIDSTGYCGISCDGAYCIVERNIASNCMLLNNDGAPFKAFGALSHHSVFRNNIAHDTQGNTEGDYNGNFQTPALYFDNYVNENTFENNTVYNVSHKGIFQNCGSYNNHILGNIIFGGGVGLDINGGLQVGDTLNRIEVKHNTFCSLGTFEYPLRQVDAFNPTVFTQGTLDSNYYFQPFATNHVVLRAGLNPIDLSLDDWKTFSAQDAHTKNAFGNYSTGTMTPTLLVNATDNDSTFNLGTTQYLDLDSNVICGSVLVPAFYSKVLIATANVCASGTVNAYILQLHNAGCTNASGKLVAMGTGGTGAFTYLWSNGATTDTIQNLAAGTYTVTVSSGGNSATRTVTLAPFGIDTVKINNACNGMNSGSIFLDDITATYPLQYVWYRNDTLLSENTAYIDSLTTGTYKYYMTDAEGCIDSGSVLIQSSIPFMEVFVSDSALCYQQTANVWYTPGLFVYDYLGNIHSTTTDTLSYTNAPGNGNLPESGFDSLGCVTNLVDPLPFVYLQSHPNPVQLYQYTDTLTSNFGNNTNGQAGSIYNWYKGGILLQSSAQPFLVIDSNGFYSCTIMNEYGCTISGTISATITALTEILSETFSIYPNPTTSKLKVSVPLIFVGEEISVYDLSGREISSQIISNAVSEINVSELASGIYFVRAKGNAKKFVKE